MFLVQNESNLEIVRDRIKKKYLSIETEFFYAESAAD
jgi:hypothetical protein